MKFTDKYELLESLTTGMVETFVANDRVRGERVLVHIVECTPQKPSQSTMEWVLESFRRVAPEPAGPVIEAGKYGETKYSYLVTKPADDAALKSWVRRYEIQGLDTQETTARPKALDRQPIETASPPLAPPPVIAPPPIKEPERAGVSVTQLLRDFDSQIKPARQKDPAPPLPNLRLGGEPSGLHSAPPWEPIRPQAAVAPKEEMPHVTRPESVAQDGKTAGFPSASFPAPPSAFGAKDNSKPGEFTSFFQGPFRGDASDLPPLTSQPIEPPRKTVGEFTAVFGSVGPRPESSAPPLEESGNIPAPSTFTGIFKDMGAPPRSVIATAPPSPVPLPSVEPIPLPKVKESTPAPMYVAPPSPVTPKPAVLPPLPTPSLEKPPVAGPSSLSGDGATGAFSRPAAEQPAPVMPAIPVGPSPYTQIISRDKLMAQSAETTAGEEGATPAAAGMFAPPALPKPPAPPKMPQVKMPAPPKLAPPAAPKAPKMPKVDAPAPPPVSMMPLVITLTVLFILAVLLVLYFVLKH